jgi:hypothetical protein
MKIGNYLNKRYQWEEMVSKFNLPDEHREGTINSLKWFVKNGHKANSLRNGFKNAKELDQEILEEIKNGESRSG